MDKWFSSNHICSVCGYKEGENRDSSMLSFFPRSFYIKC
ncbi:hypothetical protein MCG01_05090 [Enterococcus hirae]|nr:hypothetical protein [Enterococcus hirae]